jgi:hypothetical protein
LRVIAPIPVAGKESAANVSATIKAEESSPRVFSLTPSNGPMTGARRIFSRYTREKRGSIPTRDLKRRPEGYNGFFPIITEKMENLKYLF